MLSPHHQGYRARCRRQLAHTTLDRLRARHSLFPFTIMQPAFCMLFGSYCYLLTSTSDTCKVHTTIILSGDGMILLAAWTSSHVGKREATGISIGLVWSRRNSHLNVLGPGEHNNRLTVVQQALTKGLLLGLAWSEFHCVNQYRLPRRLLVICAKCNGAVTKQENQSCWQHGQLVVRRSTWRMTHTYTHIFYLLRDGRLLGCGETANSTRLPVRSEAQH